MGGRFSPSAAVEDPTWTAPATAANQVVTLTLTATDGGDADNNDVSDSVTITVRGTDPTVSIETADQTVLGGAPIDLAAMSSRGCRAYAWTADPAVGTFE